MSTLTSADMYEYILSEMTEILNKEGFIRSGKSFFYRYGEERTNACVMGFQKSMDNCPDCLRFKIKYDCVTLYDIKDFYGERLNLRILKEHLQGTLRGTEWYELSEYTLADKTIADYYRERIAPDVAYAIEHLSSDLQMK